VWSPLAIWLHEFFWTLTGFKVGQLEYFSKQFSRQFKVQNCVVLLPPSDNIGKYYLQVFYGIQIRRIGWPVETGIFFSWSNDLVSREIIKEHHMYFVSLENIFSSIAMPKLICFLDSVFSLLQMTFSHSLFQMRWD